MNSKISVITLGVADLARGVHFYKVGLGFPLKETKSGVAYFNLDGSWLALYDEQALSNYAGIAPGKGSVLLSQNVASKAEVAATLERAQAAGGTIHKATDTMSWGGVAGFLFDPDGHVWEIVWNPKASELFNEPA